MSNLDKDIKSSGLVVGGEYSYVLSGEYSYFWAEVTPSGGKWYRQFLPWVRRWWFEVNEVPGDGDIPITHAYTFYGSGGSYTLRGCIAKAMDACVIAAEEEVRRKETTDAKE